MPPNRTPSLPRRLTAGVAHLPGLLWVLAGGLAEAGVRLNEIMAAPNDRLLAKDGRGRWRPGTGPMWTDQGFAAPGWRTGAAPLGFGGAAGVGTNVAGLMQNRTPTLYLRKSFTATAADVANLGALRLRVNFDDGFVAYVNGREAGRANAGPAGHYLHHDQPAYNFAATTSDARFTPASQPGVGGAQPLTLALGPAAEWLVEGTNVLAIELHNRETGTSARIDAALEIVTATVVFDRLKHDFNTANGAEQVHRNVLGTITNTTIGTPPPGSWLTAAPGPQSAPGWSGLELRAILDPEGGYGGGGGLRMTYSQTGADQPAAFFSPPAPLGSPFPPGPLTVAALGDLGVTFRFKVSPGAAFGLRLDPSAGSTADSLVGLPALTATAGTAAVEAPLDEFADAVGGSRTRAIGAGGVGAVTTAGVLKNALTLSTGPALRDFAFSVTENNTAGAGAGGTTGHLVCEVTKAAAQPDFYGFTIQTFQLKSWTSGAITPAQLGAAWLQFEAEVPAGVPVRVSLEPSTTTAGYSQRLDLGTIVGTGAWQHHEFNPATGTNQSAFLSTLNAQPTTLVRVAFRADTPPPVGTRWKIDALGFVPWRTYSTTLAAGTNADAFVAAVNAQSSPQAVAAFEKAGTALAPDVASLTIDDFRITYTQTNAGAAATLVPMGATGWSYFPGRVAPSGGLAEPADFAAAGTDLTFADWIELLNEDASPADLTGWSLTDDRDTPRKWTFPSGTSIPGGGMLVVLADGRTTSPPGAAWPHANFSLDDAGEFLALIDAAGGVRDAIDPGYGPQDSWHSYGREAGGAWGYFREATPGQINGGPWLSSRLDPPDFLPAGGFHTGAVILTLSPPVTAATVRYTTDGTEPTATTGTVYTGPITLQPINDKTGTVVRARAFLRGRVASTTRTHTYLIDQNANLKAAPAVVLTGDPETVLYKPLGIFAIQGGSYNGDGIWTATNAASYNIPVGSGRLTDPTTPTRPYERPAQLEFFYSDGRDGFREPVGVRVSSSPYSRPRLKLTQIKTASPLPADHVEKPSLNVFFRKDYGSTSITFPLIPDTDVGRFEEFRLRAGKNDISNPFIRDEFIRRLYTDLGQVGTVGAFNTLYLNGVYKGYYNRCERLREPFMQAHHHSDQRWDVNYIGNFEDGDDVHFNSTLGPRLAADLTQKANYDALAAVLDLPNAADYFLLMVYTSMWDWPHNNWAMARERSASGLWRYYVWDAEGGFGLNGNKPANYRSFASDLLSGSTSLPRHFQRLMTSPEWRLLFADRIQKHFFNGGALTDAALTARKNACQAEVRPLMTFAGITPDTSWFTGWLNATTGRRASLFPKGTPGLAGYVAGQFRDPNGNGALNDTLWPLTPPPVLSLPAGAVPAGSTVSLTHTAPAGSTVYYTIDGSDPRVWGGAVAAGAQAYDSPLPLATSTVPLRARVRDGATGEWGPLAEALYRVGTIPASADTVVVSELMYHPPDPTAAEVAAGFADADDFEFLSLMNISNVPIDLSGLRFTAGITFDFATAKRVVIDPGQHAILGRSKAALLKRYGPDIEAVWAGGYAGGLSNVGEALTLETTDGAVVVRSFAYSDEAPWPVAADGRGSSLRLREPAANPDHAVAAHWIASAAMGGSPAGSPLALGYAEWVAWNFSAAEGGDAARSGPLADPDGDGWNNLFEWALLGHPMDASGHPGIEWARTAAPDGTSGLDVTLRLAPALAATTVTPQGSVDLQSWTAGFTKISRRIDPDGAVVERWHQDVPAGTPSIFGRVLVRHSP